MVSHLCSKSVRGMIILDTNVISELMRARPEARVLDWLAARPSAGLFTTTLTQAEIFYGLALLPQDVAATT